MTVAPNHYWPDDPADVTLASAKTFYGITIRVWDADTCVCDKCWDAHHHSEQGN